MIVMGKNSYIGGNTIIYVPNSRKILFKKIHESALDLLDEDFSFSFIVKVFSEYSEHELHQIEKEISSIYKEKREYWINLIEKSFSNKKNSSKNKIISSKNNTLNSTENIFKEENINKKNKLDHSNTYIGKLLIRLEELNLKIKNHLNIIIRERAKKEAIELQNKIDKFIVSENINSIKKK
ncbi:hypothetical protein VSU16_16620 (plasmid) [Cetobacterium somerae]|uniref:hypothetical protein n=1 Tax=Cetobacterium somerae TaxID=188913 RepID=UPI002E7B8F8C|nr:hypothetical protein [Cetobacterium somerae]WVJ03415.1 hypothetical protein VSU16_16620 [Cetobacterium somerae]